MENATFGFEPLDDNTTYKGDINCVNVPDSGDVIVGTGNDALQVGEQNNEIVLYTPVGDVNDENEATITDHPLQITDNILNVDDVIAGEIDIEGGIDVSGSLVGIEMHTLEEIYDLYRRHAGVIGFSVRKGTNRRRLKTGNDKISEKYYFCSCQGDPEKKKHADDLDSEKTKRKRKVPMTRTGCSALLRARLNKNGMYEVVTHVTSHNHELTRTEWQHHHRSERGITGLKADSIEVMTQAAMKPSAQYKLMVEEAGGEEYLGHTKKDHLNFVYRMKAKEIEGGDAQTLIDLLQKEASADPEFFFRVKLDDIGRLCNVFWVDSMMKEDYRIFGDVVVFDTTYRTNRYNLICGAFVGINNHWKNTMFGCAFLADEKIEAFEWLFSAFKESMDGSCPVTIFTDQDHAMSSALGKVWPDTRHRLCQWHIQQNAMSHFGSLKSDRTFQEAFTKCLKGCYTIDEFETSWAGMIAKYALERNTWFQRLYSLRGKWCTALSTDFFSAGILSSQRSESTNSALGFQANKTTSLTEFYSIFKATVRRWRSNEQKDEFDCSRSKPTSFMPMTGMLEHAAEVYTMSLFRIFEQEYASAVGTSIVSLPPPEEGIELYSVYPHGNQNAGHTVSYRSTELEVSCTCKNFEVSGWLCLHSIRVLHMKSVTRIPSRYVLTRWTRYAKADVWDKTCTKKLIDLNVNQEAMTWRYVMTRSYSNLISRCYHDEAARKMLDDVYAKVLKAVEAHLSTERSEPQEFYSVGDSLDATTPSVLDPPKSITKGRSARKKGGVEKSKRKKGGPKQSSASNRNEIGDVDGIIARNVRLF